jgi:hypothetical protein
MSNRKIRKDRLPIGFATTQQLISNTPIDAFVTGDVLLSVFNAKFSEFYTSIVGNAPQALDTLVEIANKLALLGAEDVSIEAMISEIIGTKASLTYVNGKLDLKADLSYVQAQVGTTNQNLAIEVSRLEGILNGKVTAVAFQTYQASVTASLVLKADQASVTASLALKADQASVDASLAIKANQATVDTSLALKADKTTVNAALALKADQTAVNTSLALKADKTAVDASLALKADLTAVNTSLALKADKTAVDASLALKADQIVVNTSLALKVDKTAVDASLALKADEVSVVSRLAGKTSTAQAETIAQNIANALEAKLLGGVGTNADTFAELKALLDNLQSLSQADLNGVMASLATKVDKQTLALFAQVQPDGKYSLTNLNGVSAKNVLIGRLTDVLNDYTAQNLNLDIQAGGVQLIKVALATQADGSISGMKLKDFLNFIVSNPNSPLFSKLSEKLDKSVFNEIANKDAGGLYTLNQLLSVTSKQFYAHNFAFFDQDVTTEDFANGVNNGESFTLAIGRREDGALLGLGVSNLADYLVNDVTHVSVKLNEKLSKSEFNQVIVPIPVIDQYVPFSNGSGTTAERSMSGGLKVDKLAVTETAVVESLAVNGLASADLSHEALTYDLQFNMNINEALGDKFMNVVLSTGEEGGQLHSANMVEFLEFIANAPNPVRRAMNFISEQNNFLSQELANLTARVADLEAMTIV